MKDRPFALVGIDSDRGTREVLAKRFADQGINWRNAIDGGTDGPLARAWSVHGWPTIYVLDESGVVQAADLRGARLDAKVEELVKKLEAKR